MQKIPKEIHFILTYEISFLSIKKIENFHFKSHSLRRKWKILFITTNFTSILFFFIILLIAYSS